MKNGILKVIRLRIAEIEKALEQCGTNDSDVSDNLRTELEGIISVLEGSIKDSHGPMLRLVSNG